MMPFGALTQPSHDVVPGVLNRETERHGSKSVSI